MRIEEAKKSRGNYLVLAHSNLTISKESFESAALPEVGVFASQRIQRHLLAMGFAQLLGRVGGTLVQGQNCPRDLNLKPVWCNWWLLLGHNGLSGRNWK